MILLLCERGSTSGLRGNCFDASVFGCFFLFSPTCPCTWLLTVAGTTYKLVVIKVFDLLWFPVDAHISGLANTVLLPLWSMNDDEAKATKWQCRDWTWRRQWNGRVGRGDGGMHFYFTLQCSYGNTSILGWKYILWIVKEKKNYNQITLSVAFPQHKASVYEKELRTQKYIFS